MSMMPWTARAASFCGISREPMGSTFGRVCLEAFDRNVPADFGRTVMALLESDYGGW